MNAQQLRNSILQEAIEGRLVPQDPNDAPASVLLERIREEKKRLFKEGKLKKKDLEETPISEDEIPFDIPDSWKWVRLENITIYISRGKSPVYSDLKKYPIVAQKCNQWSGFSLEKAKFADPSTIEKYAVERILQDGDLLWNSTGLGTLGRMAIYDSKVNPYGWAAADSHVTVIRTRSDFCNYKYLFYYFASNEVQSVIEDKSDGSTKQKELYQDTVKKYEIPLPPLAEQHRIVAKIEELLPKVEEYGKAQNELNKLNEELPERLKKSILQEAIEGRLVPQDPNDEPASVLLERIREEKKRLFKEGKLKKKDLEETPISEDEIPFDIPNSWEWVRIKYIFSMQAGKNVTSSDINSEPNDIYKYSCYGGNGLRGYVKRYNTDGVFPLVGRQGALCGNVNIASGLFWATEHAVVTDGYGMTDVKWAYYFLTALNLNQYATSTAQPGLAVSNIIEVLIPLPPLAKQHRIVVKIEELFAEIDKLKV